MRTDCTVDNEPVSCPNTDLSGYSHVTACPGYCIVYKQFNADDNFQYVIARVLGRVSAPARPPYQDAVKNWLLVMRLSEDGTHASEYWVNPLLVSRVYDVPTDVLVFFGAKTLPEVNKLRRLMEDGYIRERYILKADLT